MLFKIQIEILPIPESMDNLVVIIFTDRKLLSMITGANVPFSNTGSVLGEFSLSDILIFSINKKILFVILNLFHSSVMKSLPFLIATCNKNLNKNYKQKDFNATWTWDCKGQYCDIDIKQQQQNK